VLVYPHENGDDRGFGGGSSRPNGGRSSKGTSPTTCSSRTGTGGNSRGTSRSSSQRRASRGAGGSR
jgi:hypothetical protein